MSNSKLKPMMDAALHFGHQTHRWNPKMKPFLHGQKNGIHIFNLDKTAVYLDKALEFIKLTVASGKTIMIASTKPQATTLVMKTARDGGMMFVVSKWMPGLLTNFTTMKKRIKYFNELVRQEKAGELDKYTKKEISKLKKEIVKLEVAFGGVSEMDKMPAAIFVVDVVRDRIIVKEANKMKIPVIGIVDSNADPDGIDYPIPANDDAVSALKYIMGEVAGAIKDGKGGQKNK
ncbi:MAG: 30S ribosomal protein S2 [Candidatus Altimarinota bacterium]